MLLRRPDIKAAEKVLAAETADIGVATADLFPRISLLGGFGWESGASGSLLDTASQTWRLGPSIQWPLFQGGRIRANIDVQTAQAEAALARYEKAVLGVFQEVSTALADHSHERQTARSLKAAIVQSQKSVELSTALYQQGLSDILTVLNTEALLLRVEDEYALSQTREWTSLIRLYKALGGGWTMF
ncbi:MAG: TolC family protein [Desulfobacterales bacterium]|nr:TolC family protein [Desulfobacterales bacterium]